MKNIKRIIALLCVLFICVSSVNVSEAASGTWKCDATGWWYEYSNGGYPHSQWLQVGGSWYYFGANGYMESNGYRDGCWLDGSGAWVPAYSGGHWRYNATGWWYEDGGWYPASQWLQIDGSWYYFKDSGYMASSEWVGDYYLGASGAWEPGKVKATLSADVKAAYREKVEEHYNSRTTNQSYNSYDLIYIDDDDIPELVCDYSGYQMTVYTYYNGEAVCIMDGWPYGAGGNHGYDYTERKGLVTNLDADMAGAMYTYTFEKLENGKLVENDYYLVSSSYDIKKYGFDWNHAEDNDYHYYKVSKGTDWSADRSKLVEVDKATFKSLDLSGDTVIAGTKTKSEILKELQ